MMRLARVPHCPIMSKILKIRILILPILNVCKKIREVKLKRLLRKKRIQLKKVSIKVKWGQIILNKNPQFEMNLLSQSNLALNKNFKPSQNLLIKHILKLKLNLKSMKNRKIILQSKGQIMK